MNNKNLFPFRKKLFLISIFLFALLIVVSRVIFLNQKTEKSIGQVCFDNYCFKVELVKTQEEISRGLMFRKNLEQDRGMLFIFQEEGEYAFWMKNTLIPLDIIWINQNREVIFIKKNFQPCAGENCETVKPDKKAKYVLELIAGTIDRIGLKIGDKLEFKNGLF